MEAFVGARSGMCAWPATADSPREQLPNGSEANVSGRPPSLKPSKASPIKNTKLFVIPAEESRTFGTESQLLSWFRLVRSNYEFQLRCRNAIAHSAQSGMTNKES